MKEYFVIYIKIIEEKQRDSKNKSVRIEGPYHGPSALVKAELDEPVRILINESAHAVIHRVVEADKGAIGDAMDSVRSYFAKLKNDLLEAHEISSRAPIRLKRRKRKG